MNDVTQGDLSPGSAPSAPSQPASSTSWAADRAAQQRATHPTAPPRREQPANPNARVQPAWSDGRDGQSRHRHAAESRAAEAGGAPPASSDSTAPPPPTADGEGKVRIGELELTKQEARDLVAHKAAKDSRDLTRPQKAEDFKFGLSPNFTPPAGLDFKLDENDPAVGLYRQFALKNEFTQEQFSEGLDLVASLRVGEAHHISELKRAEVAKLGAAGTARVDAVVRWMTGTMGAAASDMARVLQAVPMASTIVAFENLIQKIQTQGSGAYTPTGRRVEGGDGKIPGYDSMTFAQKRAAQDDLKRR